MANASLIENFLESLASEKGLSKNTIQSYSLDIKQCLKITKLNIDKISSKNLNLDIEKFNRLSKLIEALEDLDDVQNVYANFDIDNKLLEKAITE